MYQLGTYHLVLPSDRFVLNISVEWVSRSHHYLVSFPLYIIPPSLFSILSPVFLVLYGKLQAHCCYGSKLSILQRALTIKAADLYTSMECDQCQNVVL